MSAHRCPRCGRFLAGVVTVANGLDQIVSVAGECRQHGRQEPAEWSPEDFEIEGYDEPGSLAKAAS